MVKHVTATEARVHFGEVLRRVSEDRETYIVERAGEPRAVVISIEEYRRLNPSAVEDDEPDWWKAILRSREMFRKSLAGRDLPDVDELIDAGRQERDDAILEGLLRREHHREADGGGQ